MACRILVVEDDSDINALLCRILSGAGYRVDSAFSGTEAQRCRKWKSMIFCSWI